MNFDYITSVKLHTTQLMLRRFKFLNFKNFLNVFRSNFIPKPKSKEQKWKADFFSTCQDGYEVCD